MNAGDANFAAVLSLGLAFWMRPNEWFSLDVECMAFVKMRGIELLHNTSCLSSQKKAMTTAPVLCDRRTAHRVGCGGYEPPQRNGALEGKPFDASDK